jgi:hypothetical protein
MARPFTTKVVTASRLREGDAVWLTRDGSWSPRHGDADLIGDAATAEARLALARGQADRIVGPYLADARPGPDGPEPAHFREAFRARGPSNRPHGKQTDR